MRFSEFCYVDLALGGPEQRNNVATVTEAQKLLRLKNGSEAHVTVCRYPNPFLEHFLTTASVRGYDGPAYADALLFEFDGKDLAESRLATLGVVDILTGFRTPREALDASFSGGRSIHLRVLSPVFGIEPGAELPSVLRALAKRIAIRAGVVIDEHVYGKTALLRVTNTRHPSGRYKIRLSLEELRSLSDDEIFALAVVPRTEFPRASANGLVPELTALYRECVEEVRARAQSSANRPSNDAILRVLEGGYSRDQRHRLVLAFAGFAAKNNIPEIQCRRIVEKLIEATRDEQLEDRIRAVEDSYKKVADGLPVKGYRELAEVLGDEPARSLAGLVGSRKTPALEREEKDLSHGRLQAAVGWAREHRSDLASRFKEIDEKFVSVLTDRDALIRETLEARERMRGQEAVAEPQGVSEDIGAEGQDEEKPRNGTCIDEPSTPPALEAAPATASVVEIARSLDVRFHVVSSADEARRILAEFAERSAKGELFGFDFETIGLDPLTGKVRLSQYAPANGPVAVIDHMSAGPLAVYADLLRDLRTAVFNAMFEASWLWHAGAPARPTIPPLPIAEDVFLENQALECSPDPLEEVTRRLLGIELDKRFQTTPKTGDLSEEEYRYAATDALVTLRAHDTLHRRLEEIRALRAYELQRDAIPLVVWMRMRGVPFDHDAHARFVDDKRKEKIALTRHLRDALGGKEPNPGALAAWLGPRLPKGINWPSTRTGRLSVNAAHRAFFASRLPQELRCVVDMFSAWQTVESLLKTFGDGIASRVRDGRVHAQFRLGGAVTGRLSCSSPNIQQLPREAGARRCVRAPEGYRLVDCDFGQIELRILALFSREKRLLDAFRDGQDIHTATAALITKKDPKEISQSERQRAKAANFGLAYGQSAAGFVSTAAASYGLLLSLEEAEHLRNSWFSSYPKVAHWQVERLREAKRTRTVRTISGRVRDLRKARKGPFDEGPGKVPLNFPVQGSAAEGLLAALRKLPAALADLDAAPIITLHDEIVLEAREDQAEEAGRRLEAVMREGMLEVLPDLPQRGLVEARVMRDWSEK
jgi:DNA polymerase-1